MAEADGPMTLSAVSNRLSRSMNELFRMFQVLVDRGYLAPAATGAGYELSPKLLTVARSSHTLRKLVAVALPQMQALAEATKYACHLSVSADQDLVVIASADAPADVNFSVKPGFRSDISASAAGAVIFGFGTYDFRERLSLLLSKRMDAADWAKFNGWADKARAQGYWIAPSDVMPGVTDVSSAVFDDTGVKATLTIPLLQSRPGIQLSQALQLLHDATAEISRKMGRPEVLPLVAPDIAAPPTGIRPMLKLVK